MQRHRNGFIVLSIILSCMLGCTIPRPPCQNTASDEINLEMQKAVHIDNKIAQRSHYLPASVSNALLPPIGPPPSFPPYGRTQHRFDISANKMPAKAFFMGLVEGTPYNMVVNPKIVGEISLKLKHVTIDQAMEAVRDVYGYEFRKTSYGYEVLPPELATQMYNVNYLNVRRIGKSRTEVSSGQISEKISGFSTSGVTSQPVVTNPEKTSGSSVDTRSKMDFWRGLEVTLKSMVGTQNGRSVVVDAQAGLVIVRAFPYELHQVAYYLDSIQSNLNRQVVLEAKILEVELDNGFQAGIDWNLFGRVASGNGGVAQQGVLTFEDRDFSHLLDFNSIFTLRVWGEFGTIIKLLQLQGNVQVLSSPRISTVNNQKAVIKVGEDSFFVTGVSTSNTIVGTNTLPSENVDLTPFFSGLTLDVTPQISDEKRVILHIHPTISDVREQQKNIVLGTTPASIGAPAVNNTFTLPLAHSTIRESDNIVRAKSGQIVVIGGLMQNRMIEEVAGVPLLTRLPLIGPFFRHTFQSAHKFELVILLRPVIVENRTWGNQIQQIDRSMMKMDRGFHAGAFPEIFGTEGESEDLH